MRPPTDEEKVSCPDAHNNSKKWAPEKVFEAGGGVERKSWWACSGSISIALVARTVPGLGCRWMSSGWRRRIASEG